MSDHHHQERVLEANIAGAKGRIGVLLTSMDAWSVKTLSDETVKLRNRQIDNLRVNIHEWQRLLDSINRMEEN